jgi:transposase-like protein
VLVAVQRSGPVRAAPVPSDKVEDLLPMINQFVDKDAHLMTDQLHAYRKVGIAYASHDWVNHSEKEFVRGDTHNNTAESFNAILERAKQGVFHYLSKKHLQRYLHEIGFRWDHRRPELKQTRKGKLKLVMKPLPVMARLRSLLSNANGRQLRRTVNGGFICFAY